MGVGAVSDFDRQTFDVKDRLIVFTYDSHWTQEAIERFMEALKPTADKLIETGAISVVALSSDITLNTINERQLTEMGLQRIPD